MNDEEKQPFMKIEIFFTEEELLDLINKNNTISQNSIDFMASFDDSKEVRELSFMYGRENALNGLAINLNRFYTERIKEMSEPFDHISENVGDKYRHYALWLLDHQFNNNRDRLVDFQNILSAYDSLFDSKFDKIFKEDLVRNHGIISEYPTDGLLESAIKYQFQMWNFLSVNSGSELRDFTIEHLNKLVESLEKRRSHFGSFDKVKPEVRLDEVKIPRLPSIYGREDLGKIFDRIWIASAEPKIFYKEDKEIFLSQFTDSPMGKVRVNASVRSAQTGIFDLYKEITQEKWNVSRMSLYISPSKPILAKWNKPAPVTFIREILRPFNNELLLKKLKKK